MQLPRNLPNPLSPTFLLFFFAKKNLKTLSLTSLHVSFLHAYFSFFQFSQSLMAFRKILYAPPPIYSDSYIDKICPSSACNSDVKICIPGCDDYCSENCPEKLIKLVPAHHAKINKTMITGLAIASVFIFITFYIMYYRFYRNTSRRNRGIPVRNQENDDQTNTHQDFVYEDHGPVLDHPIWYINTIGLQPSVINSITVFKYKKFDNFIDGTDCSVCLSEFLDDETLRLLPKCNHAFHVSCIDTWLRSHTNCPLCRAPIVSNSTSQGHTSSDHSVESSGVDETRVEISVNDHEIERGIESENDELRSEIEAERIVDDENVRNEESVQGLRRSISLDSLSAFKISQALPEITASETDRNSRTELSKQNEELSIFSKKAAASSSSSNNQSLLKFMTSSSIGRSLQIRPSTIRRSFSCGGKFFLSRNSRYSSNSVLPL